MSLWAYSPEDVQITIGSFFTLEGLAEGTFVEVVKDVMPYESSRSADGRVERKYTNNSTFSINVTLMRASPSNDTLNRLSNLDEITQKGMFPLLIKDSNGTGYFFSPSCWIEIIPPLTYSTQGDTCVWGLRADSGVVNIGGNDKVSVAEQLANLLLSGLPLVQQVLNTPTIN